MTRIASGSWLVLRGAWTGTRMASAVLLLVGCRGQPSEEPPVRIIRDMVQQPKRIGSSGAKNLVVHAASSRCKECIARESAALDEHSVFRNGDTYVPTIPLEVDLELLSRGRNRFAVFCSPCHDHTGAGQGIVAQRGFPSPVDLASPGTVKLLDGQIFEIVSQGIRNMPGLREQILPRDRWSIVAWVRVLQRSRDAGLADVEPQRVSSIKEALGAER